MVTEKLRQCNHIVLCTASIRIAAIYHTGGVVAHSMFTLPLDVNEEARRISGRTQRAERLHQSKLIKWNEAPTANKDSLVAFDTILLPPNFEQCAT